MFTLLFKVDTLSLFKVDSCDCFSRNLTLGCTDFANSAYPENWALFYETLEHTDYKEERVFLKKLYFSFNPPHKVLKCIYSRS